MNQDSPGGTSGSRRPEGAGGRTALLWFAAILATAALAWLLLTLTGIDATTSLIALAWVMIVLSTGLSTFTRRARNRRFQQRFPTPDHLRRYVDADALRAVRDRDGEISAVKQLRRHVPDVPLSEAVRLIKNL